MRIRKPPDIATMTARIKRTRQRRSTARTQAGREGGGVESEKREALIWLSRAFPVYPNDRANNSTRGCGRFPSTAAARRRLPAPGEPAVPGNPMLFRALWNDGVGQ